MSEKNLKILGWIGTVLSVVMYVSYIPQIWNDVHGQKNAVYTAFSRRGQLYYMDGLRAFKRETRLSFVGGKFSRRYFRYTCNNSRILIDPMRGRRKSLLLFHHPLST